MSDRYVKREKLEEVETQLRASDSARVLIEQERDAARVEIADLHQLIEAADAQLLQASDSARVRVEELETALVEARTQRGDSLGVFVGDAMRVSTVLLKDIASLPEHEAAVVHLADVRTEDDGTKTLVLTRAAPAAAAEGRDGD